MQKISVVTNDPVLYAQIESDINSKFSSLKVCQITQPEKLCQHLEQNDLQLIIADYEFSHQYLKQTKIPASCKVVSLLDSAEQTLPTYADFSVSLPLNRAIIQQIIEVCHKQHKLTQELLDLTNTSFFDRFICNKDLKILEASAPNYQLYGISDQKLVGQSMANLFPKLFYNELSTRIPQVLKNQKRQEFVTKGEIVNRKVWFYIYLKPLPEKRCKIIIKDVSNLNLSSNIHETLFEIAHAVTTSDNMQELYGKIHQSLKRVLAADNFYIALLDSTEKSIYSPYFKDKRYEVETPINLRKDGISNYIIRKKKPLFIDSEIRQNLIAEGEIADYQSTSVSMLAAPLTIGEEVIGMIGIRSFSKKNIYTHSHLEILEFISQLIATSIAQKRTEKQINQAFEEKDTLLRELYHRTKNNMQVIISMLSIQSKTTQDKFLQNKFKEISTRISTMSLAHEKLYKSNDLTKLNLREYVNDLTRLLNRSYYIPKLQIEQEIEIADIPVSIDTALPLGLALNELISNSYRHAFQNNVQGKIRISIKRHDAERLYLEYSDNGVGLTDDFDLKSSVKMGLNNFIATIKHQMNGSVEFENRDGLRWKVLFYDNLYTKRI